MPEPLSLAGLLAKWTMTTIGSAVGASISLVAPAKNHVDAGVRFAVCFAFTMCCSPAVTRGIVRLCSIGPDSIPDVTLMVACVFAVASWSIIHAILKVAEKRSEGLAEDGLATLFPWFKSHQPDKAPPKDSP
jgi:hypothetical protein